MSEIAHIEASRGFFSNVSVTWCGMRVPNAKSAGMFWKTCPSCKAAKNAGRRPK